MRNQERIFVIGHKNPDTDSICSAIAYADIKNRTSQKVKYIPKRADLSKRVSFRTDYKYAIWEDYVIIYKVGNEYVEIYRVINRCQDITRIFD